MDFEGILTEAHRDAAAYVAAEIAIRPEDGTACDCGFAWVTISGVSPLARWCRDKLKELPENAVYFDRARFGDKGYPRGWQFWKPGNFKGQSVRIHEAGARGFRDALARHGYSAHIGSRLD